MRCSTLATVRSGESSMALALITFTTFIELRSISRARISVLPLARPCTVAVPSVRSMAVSVIDTLSAVGRISRDS